MMGIIGDVAQLGTVALVGIGGWLAYPYIKAWIDAGGVNHTDSPGYTNPILPGGLPIPVGSTGGFYVPSPDTAYPDHPFHNILGLDQVYDLGWDWMARFRQNNYDENGVLI